MKHTILYDDVLDGSRIVTMDNCVCQFYDIKRDYDSIIYGKSQMGYAVIKELSL